MSLEAPKSFLSFQKSNYPAGTFRDLRGSWQRKGEERNDFFTTCTDTRLSSCWASKIKGTFHHRTLGCWKVFGSRILIKGRLFSCETRVKAALRQEFTKAVWKIQQLPPVFSLPSNQIGTVWFYCVKTTQLPFSGVHCCLDYGWL